MNPPLPVRALYARLKTAQPWPQAAPLIGHALSRWPLGHCMGVFMGLFGLSIRWFSLPRSRMNEAVALSSAGWETFERDDDPTAGEGYRTEPLGLFAQDGPGWLSREGGLPPEDRGVSAGADQEHPERLLLLTWYDSMTSWERSRTPHPQATAHFRQRAALTSSIVAYATRLARTA